MFGLARPGRPSRRWSAPPTARTAPPWTARPRLPDHLDAAQLGLSREPFQVLQDLAAQCCGSSTRT
jgi:hypothetical protein